jgi:hypothetical protein
MSNGFARYPAASTDARAARFPSAEMTTIGILLARTLAKGLRKREPVHHRHHQVQQDDGGRLRLDALERLHAVPCPRDAIPFPFEDVADGVEDVGVVVDDQHEWMGHGSAGDSGAGVYVVARASVRTYRSSETARFPQRLRDPPRNRERERPPLRIAGRALPGVFERARRRRVTRERQLDALRARPGDYPHRGIVGTGDGEQGLDHALEQRSICRGDDRTLEIHGDRRGVARAPVQKPIDDLA